jgi:hypothetical protein
MTHVGPEDTTSGNNLRRGQGDEVGPDHTLDRYGRIASVSATQDATQFGHSISPVCVSTFKCLFIQTQPTWALIDTGGLPP